jgi:hypothetical protein
MGTPFSEIPLPHVFPLPPTKLVLKIIIITHKIEIGLGTIILLIIDK